MRLGNVYVKQQKFAQEGKGSRRGGSNTVGAELGLRHQLTARIVPDAGIGTEFTGPADRSALFVTTGISVGY